MLDDRDARPEQGGVHRALAGAGVVDVHRVDADDRRAGGDEPLDGVHPDVRVRRRRRSRRSPSGGPSRCGTARPARPRRRRRAGRRRPPGAPVASTSDARHADDAGEVEPGQVVAVGEAVERRVEVGAGVGHHVDAPDLELVARRVRAPVTPPASRWSVIDGRGQAGVGDEPVADRVAEVDDRHRSSLLSRGPPWPRRSDAATTRATSGPPATGRPGTRGPGPTTRSVRAPGGPAPSRRGAPMSTNPSLRRALSRRFRRRPRRARCRRHRVGPRVDRRGGGDGRGLHVADVRRARTGARARRPTEVRIQMPEAIPQVTPTVDAQLGRHEGHGARSTHADRRRSRPAAHRARGRGGVHGARAAARGLPPGVRAQPADPRRRQRHAVVPDDPVVRGRRDGVDRAADGRRRRARAGPAAVRRRGRPADDAPIAEVDAGGDDDDSDGATRASPSPASSPASAASDSAASRCARSSVRR